jgi:hypothetical protein
MKFLSSKTIATALLATGVVTGGMVSAANAGGFTTATCDVTDITDLTGAAAADACAGGFGGNDSQGDAWSTQLNDNDIFGDYNWTNLYDMDGDGKDLTDYKIDSANGSNDLFRISYSEGKIEFYQDIDVQFALTLKAGNFWSAYSFEGVTANEIFDFDTTGVAVKNNGSSPALSHASIYFSDNSITPDTPDPQEVPEPTVIGGLLMLGAGLATSRRRRVK